MRKPLVVANWKMQGSLELIKHWIPIIKKAAENEKVQCVVCPSFIYIPAIAELAKNSKLAWGAQDVSNKEQGAFTGQTSATMLKEFACRYVIIGHSERRHYNHETDIIIAEKFITAQEEGLIPILCVGETAEQRNEGKTEEVILRQLSVVLKQVGIEAFSKAVIAYEPIWAIGSGVSATPAQAQAVHEIIRNKLADEDIDIAEQISILYGGSIKPENAKALFAESDIDGGLIGGASLDAEDFAKIATSF